ncbi:MULTISPECIES: NAD-dependent epimerase/dehydratase family protein [unclassified Sphingobacterium]|uniref:NAD-dependent epimerase/dehydratase family protein n=1 Tax=unclassified Sphingobacterium TaxID=2609468 RepID=UPI0025FC6255|nr:MULTISPECIES: NAD-dependent epimerase/dehydratase family protein [unclassified Sphingobacterium]
MINVILGCSGFIGKNLLNSLSDSVGLSLRRQDWKDKLAASNVNAIINLVGKAHDHSGRSVESDYYYANVELTKQIFKEFLRSSAKLLIHVSSIASQEEFESLQPLNETDECRPVSWYGQSKRQAEEWLLQQEIPVGKKVIIIRPPMVHGPGDKGNLGLLYKMISKGVPYPLASFDNVRSFIAIDNLVFFIQKIIEKMNSLDTGIYHVADNEPVSTREIITIIKNVTGKTVPDLALPKFFVKSIAKIGDFIPIPLNSKRLKKMTSNLLVSNNRIKQLLDIDCLPMTAQLGIKKTIESFR